MLGIPRDVEVEGYSNFVFPTRTGRPMTPAGVNFKLKNVVKAYNKAETEAAEKERREPQLLPHISSHSGRHTCCSRFAEDPSMPPKMTQRFMRHAHIQTSYDVYAHVTDDELFAEAVRKADARKAAGEG